LPGNHSTQEQSNSQYGDPENWMSVSAIRNAAKDSQLFQLIHWDISI